MRPPALAQAIVEAAAPASECEIVAGDLHEEYLRITYSHGAKAASRWYWAQALLSVPPLLSYSKPNRSTFGRIGVALIALAVLSAMLVVFTVIDEISQTRFGSGRIPHYAWVYIYNVDAFVFGAILAWLVRTDGLRVAFFASVFLVLCFVIPAAAGHPGSQAPLSAWIQLLAVVPVMCIGAGIYQVFRRRAASSN